MAMCRAKQLGRNVFQFYAPAMNEQTSERLQLENDLHHALQRAEFVLHFQPKADLASGAITGFEALLRWQSCGALIQPSEFIPQLEESGLIVPVGAWVLRAACSQIRAWQAAGITPVPVAVNLSAQQFQRQNLRLMVKQALLDHQIDPCWLELEITESAAMQHAEEAITTLRELKSLGVRIAIDDFGTGYSSLSYLKQLPVDTLKIDRSFIRDLPANADDASIAQAVITMAHSLKLNVIAEGVENEAQLAFLATHGCDEMQGYYLSRALPESDATALLTSGARLKMRPQPCPLTAAHGRPRPVLQLHQGEMRRNGADRGNERMPAVAEVCCVAGAQIAG
jgi:EAL domain-containing protein (putative c-di-GMP-specific phosphodiesterase class I)